MNYKRLYPFLSIAFGAGLLCWELLRLPAGEPTVGNITMVALLLAAALTGLLLRGITRKAFFHNLLTLHQSLSFEVIISAYTMLNPVGRHAKFEKWFMIRETGMNEMDLEQWQIIRRHLYIMLCCCGITLVLTISGNTTGMMISGWLTAMLSGWYFATTDNGRVAMAKLLLFYVLVYLAEGSLFVLGCGIYTGYANAITLYVLFNLFFACSFIPLGIGFAELPVLWRNSNVLLIPMLFFHAFRILPLLLLLQLIYLARYKFTFRDFFSDKIAEQLRATVRPALGWPELDQHHSGTPYVSLVIPAYNEADRLPGYLEKIKKYMDQRHDLTFEVIIVDDGSKDRTAELVETEVAHDPRIKLLRQIPNQGKGQAVRRGVLSAQGYYIIYADADGATPIEELDKLLSAVGNKGEIIIGSRRAADEGSERKRNRLRAMMGMVFYKTVNYFAVPGIHDSQCGFKMFRHDVASRLFERGYEKGWAFDVELLYLAQLFGFGIIEVPVNWHEVAGSKVNPFKDALKMLIAVFRIRHRHRGFFNKKTIMEQQE